MCPDSAIHDYISGSQEQGNMQSIMSLLPLGTFTFALGVARMML